VTRALDAIRHTGRMAGFVCYYLWEVVVANAVVARELVTPGLQIEPGIVELRLRSRRQRDVVLLAGLISLTPGTLVLRISDPGDRADPPVLYVHGLHARDPEVFRRSLTELEDRMLAALHGEATRPARPGSPPTSGGTVS
jgi:multicomponent Na+:H+ antiporter subunit E